MWDLVGIVDGTYIPELCAKDPTGTETVESLDPESFCGTRGISVRHTAETLEQLGKSSISTCAWECRYGITLTITDAGPELYDTTRGSATNRQTQNVWSFGLPSVHYTRCQGQVSQRPHWSKNSQKLSTYL